MSSTTFASSQSSCFVTVIGGTAQLLTAVQLPLKDASRLVVTTGRDGTGDVDVVKTIAVTGTIVDEFVAVDVSLDANQLAGCTVLVTVDGGVQSTKTRAVDVDGLAADTELAGSCKTTELPVERAGDGRIRTPCTLR